MSSAMSVPTVEPRSRILSCGASHLRVRYTPFVSTCYVRCADGTDDLKLVGQVCLLDNLEGTVKGRVVHYG